MSSFEPGISGLSPTPVAGQPPSRHPLPSPGANAGSGSGLRVAAQEPCVRPGKPANSSGTRSGLGRLFGWLLVCDLAFMLIDQIEPRVMPVLLRRYGATDSQIAFMVSSLPAILMLIVNPVVSYCSDRTRSRWGRRIPYLAVVTPLVSLFLALTPFAPDIAQACGRFPAVAATLARVSVSPTLLVFGMIILVYQTFKSVVPAVFFSLLRDVVPLGHLGRFMSLFRIVGALAIFALTYWLVGMIDTHPKPVFVGVAALNLLAFGAMCGSVREGEYPSVVDKLASPGAKGIGFAIRNYWSECFSAPIYWWMYGARLLVYATQLLMGFMIFFPQHDLNLGLETSARFMAWPALAWLVCAYPVGILVDRIGAVRVFSLSLWLNAVAYLLSFALVTGRASYFVSAMVTGLLFWMVMLAQLVFLQTLVHPGRVGQLSSANALLQAIVIAGVISPLLGWFLDAMKGFHAVWHVPLVGTVHLGQYRFVNLVMAELYLIALLCAERARYHWQRLGGPRHYVAPL